MATAEPGSPQLASWGRRAAALLVDGVVVSAVFVGSVLLAVATEDAETGEVPVAVGLLVIFAFLAFPLLYWWLMVGRWGQTLGKMALGEKVVRAEDAGPVGYARAFGRMATQSLLGLFVVPLFIAYLWPLWDRRKQTLYDKMVGTIVVRRR
jgi:uncharacterized RDD family membrane protein YckC